MSAAMADPVLVMLVLIVVGIALMAFFLMRERTVFVLRISGGQPRTVRGEPPPGFVGACADVCRLYRIEHGHIRGVRTGASVELRFSREIPERAQQPFRNVWSPRPPGGGGGGGLRASG
jgi:hypothetical protein